MTDEGFLGRWSRRKRAARGTGSDAPPATDVADANGADSIERVAKPPRPGVMNTEASEPTIGELAGLAEPAADDAVAADPNADLTPLDDQASEPPDLPPIGGLDKDSDFSVFMKQGVPEDLRRLALRKLWRLHPGIIDGLDDYDEDYTLAKVVAEKVSSLYRDGQGMPGAEDKAARGAGVEVGAEPAPSAAGDDDAGAEAVSSPAGEGDIEAEEKTDAGTEAVSGAAGEGDIEAEETTDVSRVSDAAAPEGPQEGPGKA